MMNAKKILLILFGIILWTGVNAQCYQNNMTKGKSAYNTGQYSSAKIYFNNATKCSDCKDKSEPQRWIKKCNNKIYYSNYLKKGESNYNNGYYSSALSNFKTAQNYSNTYEVKNWIDKCNNKITIKNQNNNNNAPDNMIFVKGGTFKMGSNDGASDEKPIHSVTVSDFYIGKYEVTFAEYDKFCDATGRNKPNDVGWGRGNRPVINVSWNDATAYCKWLSQQTGQTYRLPTEAEWEYAARGGNKSKGYKYAGSNNIDEVAEYEVNNDKYTKPVGGKKPNELGIYDMSGNVWEWCSDRYSPSYYSNSPQNNPQGVSSGSRRVRRGGSWSSYSASYCRVAFRGNNYPTNSGNNNIGFRIIRTP